MAPVRVLLVHPLGFNTDAVLPLALGYLKSALADHPAEVKILDCALHDISADSPQYRQNLLDFQPHVVGVSSWSPMYQEALSLLRIAKQTLPNTMTVMGGAHATTYFKAVMENPFIDLVFRGEAEQAFPAFIDLLHQGNRDFSKIDGLVYRDEAGQLSEKCPALIERLDDLALPDYDAMDLDGYIANGYRLLTRQARNAPVWFTRGCPYRCQFCAAPTLSGKPIRRHSPDYVRRWIDYLYREKGIRWINVIDDNFTFHFRHAKDICRTIIDMGLADLKFSTPNGVRMQKGDRELWSLMKQAGWTWVCVAPESGSEKTLELMKKDLDLAEASDAVRDMKSAGLRVVGFFILGYPGEEVEDLLKTRRYAIATPFDFVLFHNFQAIPGTPVFDMLVAENRISPDFLPGSYHSMDLKWRTESLRAINVRHFIIATYLQLCLRRPTTVIKFIQMFGADVLIDRFAALMGLAHRLFGRNKAAVS